MSYKTSLARKSAAARIKALRRPFIFAKIRTRKLPTFARDAVFQNCVFQLSAVLEDYLSEICNQWFSNLASSKANNASLPLSSRAFFAVKIQEEAFKRFIAFGDESDVVNRTISQIQIFNLFDNNGTLPNFDFGKKLIKDRKFPSVDNLGTLFRRLGIPKIIQLISKRTKSNMELSLQGFMDVRNALAHENPPSITDLDVARYFYQIGRWIEAIDREFYAHVNKVSGAKFWK